MSRKPDQINFRAWDENFGKMLTCEEFPVYYEVDNGFHSGKYADNGDWYDLPLMQSTGLLDKNGVMIFEDDVVGTKVELPLSSGPMVLAHGECLTPMNA
jgi:uncharacterized phage protein (TIGR01671 family)